MNLKKLKAAEQRFLDLYPLGFMDPDMQAIIKRFRVVQLNAQAKEHFAKRQFGDARVVAENAAKLISRSATVSIFEKPRFRDHVPHLEPRERQAFANGLESLIHGTPAKQKKGFEALVEILAPIKLAKWTLITLVPSHYAPTKELFVKPTTTKQVIEYFELSGPRYNARPSWEFYSWYRDAILDMKAQVHESIAPSNGAFTGFLMMSMRAAYASK